MKSGMRNKRWASALTQRALAAATIFFIWRAFGEAAAVREVSYSEFIDAP